MSALGQKQTCAAHKPMSAKCRKRIFTKWIGQKKKTASWRFLQNQISFLIRRRLRVGNSHTTAVAFLMPIADMSGIRDNKKPRAFSPEGFPATYQIDQAACFRFLRHPISPNTPRPVAKSGSAAGSGVSFRKPRISPPRNALL